jgi:curved DNA-binding protein CbpA
VKQRLEAWLERLGGVSYYELLDVASSAGQAEVRQAFRAFALAFHPDQHRGEPPEVRAAARAVFQRGAEAYRALVDPELRLLYDFGLSRGKLRLEASGAGAADPLAGKPLDELCRSAGAKLSAQKAAKLLAQGELARGREELERALGFDGGANPALRQRLDALDLALFRAARAGEGPPKAGGGSRV